MNTTSLFGPEQANLELNWSKSNLTPERAWLKRNVLMPRYVNLRRISLLILQLGD